MRLSLAIVALLGMLSFGIIGAPETSAAAPSNTTTKPVHPETVTVTSGDTLARIADRYGLNPAKLFNESPGIRAPGRIQPGQTVILPVSGMAHPAPSPAPQPTAPAASHTSRPRTVTVHAGDTLQTIASQDGMGYHRLFNANPSLKNPNVIYPGQTLRLPPEGKTLSKRPLPHAAKQPGQDVKPAPSQASSAPHHTAPVHHETAPSIQSAATQPPSPEAATSPPAGAAWERLAQCESGGNWHIDSGNGFYGGLQFTLSSWQAAGGTGLPSTASKSEQIMRAGKLKAMQGWQAWPACSAKLGLR